MNMEANSKVVDDILYVFHINPNNDLMATSVIATVNYDYVLFVNGMNDTIYGFNTTTKRIRKSNITACGSDTLYLAITRDKAMDELIVFGYMRQMSDVPIPYGIQQYVCTLICNEKLHLIEFVFSDHYEIAVDDIINSLEIDSETDD